MPVAGGEGCPWQQCRMGGCWGDTCLKLCHGQNPSSPPAIPSGKAPNAGSMATWAQSWQGTGPDPIPRP